MDGTRIRMVTFVGTDVHHEHTKALPLLSAFRLCECVCVWFLLSTQPHTTTNSPIEKQPVEREEAIRGSSWFKMQESEHSSLYTMYMWCKHTHARTHAHTHMHAHTHHTHTHTHTQLMLPAFTTSLLPYHMDTQRRDTTQ